MSDELNRLSSWLRAQPSTALILAPFADALASRRRVLVDCPSPASVTESIVQLIHRRHVRSYMAVTSGTKSVYVVYCAENFNYFILL